jgi:hypothetical protein
MNFKYLVMLFAALVIFSAASAHIPQLAPELSDYTNPVIVSDPVTSYAFYGKLNGAPQVYKIESNQSFNLYVNLLVPYVGQELNSFIGFDIVKDGKVIANFSSYNNWTKWYEEYGKEWYLWGPTYDDNATAGTYYVTVYSSTNSESYSLATGKNEKFGAPEIVWAMIVVPYINAKFWGDYSTILTYLGIVAAVVIAIAVYMKFFKKK